MRRETHDIGDETTLGDMTLPKERIDHALRPVHDQERPGEHQAASKKEQELKLIHGLASLLEVQTTGAWGTLAIWRSLACCSTSPETTSRT